MSTPTNFITPFESSGPRQLDIGASTFNLPMATKVHRSTLSGRPIAHVQLPDGSVHQLHQGGELKLSKKQQEAIRAKHFAKA